ncbi:IS66 family insertion sequence element accessory protein TnpB [Amphritea sp. 2_MG-2023]|uniref:IS66 family insertion sequence element accessory protein TnpB n=1 Tax=Amphritea TaxID=515417 RepID=UPI001C076FA4|nr:MULTISPECIES: IS66 family insertion sequence element accessory protein TnpB [Amphritea]MBU2965230.1 IS66 family insertion sequence element accessory protein TnpB [Amphritea atlantica]MDO6420839.1 IS66 family insertion sequence element accessory protein TnpB [Amphritea sp. 2_MG-2023]
MLRPTDSMQVYLYAEPVDMRKSIDGLSVLVEQEMMLSPSRDALFVFCNRGRDKIKLLCWERNGFIVWYKRLEKQRFRWPKSEDTLSLTGQELNWLLDGFDIFNNRPHQPLYFDSVS